VRQPKLPRIIANANGNKMNLRWDAPDNLPFSMPIDIEVNGKTRRVEMKNGAATIDYVGKDLPVVDRRSLVLKAMR